MFWSKKTIWNLSTVLMAVKEDIIANATICLLAVVGLVLVDGGSANADFTFGTPTNLGQTVNSSDKDAWPSISADGLTLFFMSDRPSGYGSWDLWVTTRDTIDDEWGTPMNLGPTVNSSAHDGGPGISADGLVLYFSSLRSGGLGLEDIWVTRRASKDDPWAEPVNLGPPFNSSAYDFGVFISVDGLELYFNSTRPAGFGGHDLYVTRRETIDDDWGAAANLGSLVNGSSHDIAPTISGDGLYLFFSDHPAGRFRLGGFGGADIWVTSRPTTSDDWGVPVNLGPTVNSSANDGIPSISADGYTLYFGSNRAGGIGDADLWQVSIIPIVDFNGDGIVDSADMCIMIDYWGTDEPLCDIGPMPWGDGIVDVQDLIVLAEHLFEEIPPV